MRPFVIGIVVLLLVSSVAYAASMTGTVKTLGGGSSSVPHCQVLDYDIAASDTITSVNANVECDIGGTYKVSASVNSGACSGETTGVVLTGGTPLVVAVSISPSVTISGSTYDVDLQVKK